MLKSELQKNTFFSLVIKGYVLLQAAILFWCLFTKIIYWFNFQFRGLYTKWVVLPEIEAILGKDFMQQASKKFAQEILGMKRWTTSIGGMDLTNHYIGYAARSKGRFLGTAELGWIHNVYLTYILLEALRKVEVQKEGEAKRELLDVPSAVSVQKAFLCVQLIFTKRIQELNRDGTLKKTDQLVFDDFEWFFHETKEELRAILRSRVRERLAPEHKHKIPIRHGFMQTPVDPSLPDVVKRMGLQNNGNGWTFSPFAFRREFNTFKKTEPLSSEGSMSLNPIMLTLMRYYFQVAFGLLLIVAVRSVFVTHFDPIFDQILSKQNMWALIGLVASLVLAAVSRLRAVKSDNGSKERKQGRWLNALFLAMAFVSISVFTPPLPEVGALKLIVGGLVAAELLTRSVWDQSLFQLSFKNIFPNTAIVGGVRSPLTYFIHHALYFVFSLAMGLAVWDWYAGIFSKISVLGVWFSLLGGAVFVIGCLCIRHFSGKTFLFRRDNRWWVLKHWIHAGVFLQFLISLMFDHEVRLMMGLLPFVAMLILNMYAFWGALVGTQEC